MEQKKTSQNWSIALRHFLLSGLLFPIVFLLPTAAILNLVFKITPQSMGEIYYLIPLPITALAIWVGNIVAIRQRSYTVKQSEMILQYSMLFFILSEIISLSLVRNTKISIGLDIGLIVVRIVIYYVIGKKYIAKTIKE
jgi:hypothetical protein